MTNTYEWTGRVGDAWAREWRRTDRSFTDLSRQLNAAIAAVAPEAGHAIDLGCGAGQTSIALATARPALTVTGVDLSAELIAVASDRAAAIGNLDFRVGDAAALDPAIAAGFFVSRHGVMFFADPVAAFAVIGRAAVPGARIVFSCFAERVRNPWACVLDDEAETPAAVVGAYTPGPFGFADQLLVADIFAKAGWVDAQAIPIDFTYVAGSGDDPVADAIDFWKNIGPVSTILAAANPDRRAAMLDRLANVLAGHESEGQIIFPAAAWIWTATVGDPA